MAAGDFTLFNAFYTDEANEIHDFVGTPDTLKLAIITATITPTAADATPSWDGTSGVDYDGNEVDSTSANYPSGGVTLSGVTFTQSGGINVLDSNAITITQDAVDGWTDGRWGILYNDTVSTKNAIGFYDLGSTRSLAAGNVTITPGANGWARKGAGTIS